MIRLPYAEESRLRQYVGLSRFDTVYRKVINRRTDRIAVTNKSREMWTFYTYKSFHTVVTSATVTLLTAERSTPVCIDLIKAIITTHKEFTRHTRSN